VSAFRHAPTIAEAQASGRDSFGVLRLALALAVVFSHMGSVTTGDIAGEPLHASTGFSLGEHAVNGFFAVSGFLVAMSYERRGLKGYALARALRIAPALVACALFVALVIGAIMTTRSLTAYYADGQTWRFIAQTIFNFRSNAELPGVFQQNPFRFVIGTVWTLKYEIYCYIGLGLAGWLGLLQRRGLALAVGAMLFAAIMALDFFRPDAGKAVQTSLRLPFIFICGTVLYLWRDRVRLSWPLVAAGAILCGITLGAFPYKALMFLMEAYAALVFALGPGAGKLPEPKADLSYGAYLYGWPAQQSLHAAFPAVGAGLLLLPSVALTLALAALSWFLIEKPALNFKPGRPRSPPD
jgi:peptidoglycan/LPS O-acetylase OafA/YrhL